MTSMSFATLDRAINGGLGPAVVPGESREILVGILQGRVRLAAVRHPLGFFCLPVIRDGDLGVCIHVWTYVVPGANVTTSTVHCHSWDLLSFVLYGQVSHALFELEDDRDGPYRVFEVVSRGDLDQLGPTSRRVRCRQRERRVIGPGASFRLTAGQFHSSGVAGGTEAATVVLGRTMGTTDLTIGAQGIVDHRVRRQNCSAEETSRVVQAAIRGLELANRGVSD